VSVTERVVAVLSRIADTDEVSRNPDIPLYEAGVLDSLATVELMVALSEEFGVDISPAEFEREQWATPRKIVAFIEARAGP